MAGPIATGNLPKLLWPGLYSVFGTNYGEPTQEWVHLVDKADSEQAWEDFVSVTGFGLVQIKPEGQPVAYDSQVQGYTTRATHIAYSLGFQVTHEEIKDNKYKKVAEERSGALGFSFRQTKEINVANLYNRAFNAAYTLADGLPLCSPSHVLIGGGTFSNALAVGADLCEAALEDMVIQLKTFVDDRGLKINVMPRSVIVPIAEEFNIQRILKSTFQSANANNDPNILRETGTFPGGYHVNRYLTGTHSFFIRTELPKKQQLLLLQREEMNFAQDNDFGTKNKLYVGYERYVVVAPDPRAIIGSLGP